MSNNFTSWGRPFTDAKMDMYGGDVTQRYQLGAQQMTVPDDKFSEGVQKTQQPIVTGTSVIGLKFKDGIMLAADNLASYGSLARFKDIQRLYGVGSNTIIGAAGDMSDFQHVQHQLDTLITDEYCHDDGHSLGPAQIYEYMSTLMYHRRSQLNPLWNAFVVGGVDPKSGESTLAYVDLLGTTYSAPTIGTGYASMIAIPLLRRLVEDRQEPLNKEDALDIIKTCMKVLFYRDARSLNKFQVATITKEGSEISQSMSVDTEWGFAEGIRGYGGQTQ
ncbi:hypothetical protein E3P81_02994 [Wallemia ichthyophaga]|nr:hypothetical protein E3P97_03128 [Wallemia ichthyophaga]TIB10993.1 hypothetical protein E3P93_02731 [Wallemia ichthyophaga]TIB30222.1 hypothetical protein E3P85_02823 [Wallemia ichthyophaga]TIB45132.1 hypothetical protein E3P82_03054 [Wallemia ichthyophaga]TIB48160.1 hypothetical protein E3P81_02994 [Wallemia ichthyophaga]